MRILFLLLAGYAVHRIIEENRPRALLPRLRPAARSIIPDPGRSSAR